MISIYLIPLICHATCNLYVVSRVLNLTSTCSYSTPLQPKQLYPCNAQQGIQSHLMASTKVIPVEAIPPVAALDLSTSLGTDPLPTVRINNSNLGEIKAAIDDIVKKVAINIRSLYSLHTDPTAPLGSSVHTFPPAPDRPPRIGLHVGSPRARIRGLCLLCRL
jgi:hypothetical protein